MDSIILALLSLARLMKNPALGGGGTKADDNVALVLHLVELIQGGRRAAKALEAFAQEIKAMADAGKQPTPRDFDALTARLDAALIVVEEAKQRLNPPAPVQPPGESITGQPSTQPLMNGEQKPADPPVT